MSKVKLYDFFSAFVSAALVALIGAILTVGDVFHLDWHQLANTAILAGLASFLKVLMTNRQGDFAGVIKVKQGDIRG